MIAILLLGACSAADTEPADDVTADSAATQADEAPAMLGGCILMSPIGDVPANVYEVTDVTATDAYPPFTKELTSYGLKLVARDDASDDFMRLVGKTIAEICPRDENLDLATQEETLTNLYRYKALIPVAVGGWRAGSCNHR